MRAASVAEIRDAEARAGVSGYTLMKRAGVHIARELREISGGFSRIVFLAGTGDNGGDAFVGAALTDFPRVKVFAAQERDSYRGEAAEALAEFGARLDLEVREKLLPGDLLPGDLVVDGIFGIGFHGETVRAPFDQWIGNVNASRLFVFSLDVPSGIDADGGTAAKNGAIRAGRTLCFGYPKKGLLTKEAMEYAGVVRVADIGLPENASADGTFCYTMLEAARDLPRRAVDCHKNGCGRVLALCASARYPGAGRLAAEAALRSGAGLVTLASPVAPQNLPSALLFEELPSEQGKTDPSAAAKLRAWNACDALVSGCGWGEQVAGWLGVVQSFPGALVMDADALNLLARHPSLWKRRGNVVLTPHPGEAARLGAAFGIGEKLPREVFARRLAETLGAVVVLKGAGTIVASGEGEISRNLSGCARLATAGSGDVLAGMIGALLAMKIAPFTAAKLGVFLHGLAGEIAPEGVIADDLLLYLGEAKSSVARHGAPSMRL